MIYSGSLQERTEDRVLHESGAKTLKAFSKDNVFSDNDYNDTDYLFPDPRLLKLPRDIQKLILSLIQDCTNPKLKFRPNLDEILFSLKVIVEEMGRLIVSKKNKSAESPGSVPRPFKKNRFSDGIRTDGQLSDSEVTQQILMAPLTAAHSLSDEELVSQHIPTDYFTSAHTPAIRIEGIMEGNIITSSSWDI